jgi:hypothetical protein
MGASVMTSDFLVYVLLGAFGGLLHSIFLNNSRLLLPHAERKQRIHLGFLGDVLLGIGASLGILYFVVPAEFYKQVGLSIVSGFGGGTFLGSLYNKMAFETERSKVDVMIRLWEEKLGE